jgi:hypothetical protein
MPKRPRDQNQLAKVIVDIAIGEAQDDLSTVKRQPFRKGRAGGLKGGKSRAKALGPNERHEIAKLAARARWRKKD